MPTYGAYWETDFRQCPLRGVRGSELTAGVVFGSWKILLIPSTASLGEAGEGGKKTAVMIVFNEGALFFCRSGSLWGCVCDVGGGGVGGGVLKGVGGAWI